MDIEIEFACKDHLRPGHFRYGVINPPLRYKCDHCDNDAQEFRYYATGEIEVQAGVPKKGGKLGRRARLARTLKKLG